jgi:nucleoside-diphosphate-sugar epimerase
MSNLAVITGTSGALGTAIAKRFKQSGYTVCGLDITACLRVKPRHKAHATPGVLAAPP